MAWESSYRFRGYLYLPCLVAPLATSSLPPFFPHCLSSDSEFGGKGGLIPGMANREQGGRGRGCWPDVSLANVRVSAHVYFLFAISLAQQDDQEDISPGLAEQQWDKKLPEPLSWRSDEEDEDSDFGEEQRDCYLKVLW